MFDWVKEFDGAVTVCNTDFIIVYMNDVAIKEFEKYGGEGLIGQSLLACHNPNSCDTIKAQMLTGKTHSYIKTKKDGRKKLIRQSAWTQKGKICGLVELSFYI